MKRVNILKFIILIINIIIITRLFNICIINHDYYLNKKNNIDNTYITSRSAPRGRIIDSNGNILVDNKGVRIVVFRYLDDINKSDIIKNAIYLSNITNISNLTITNNMKKEYYYVIHKDEIDSLVNSFIINRYNNRKISNDDLINYKYSLIKDEDILNIGSEAYFYYLMTNGSYLEDKILITNPDNEIITKIQESNLLGIRIDMSYERIYNYDTCLNELFGSIGSIQKEDKDYYLELGYNLNDVIGVSFIEEYYESTLKGEKAIYKVNDDNTITLISDYIRGSDLILSLDIEKQLLIENSLKEEIIEAKKNPSSKYYNGSYIVISDPSNGSIISLVALKYDNNTFTSDVIGLLTNSYTVGSVVKGASQTVAYKYNAIDINKKVLDGCIKLYAQGNKCSWKSLGYLSDIDALTYSSNYYQFINAIKVANQEYKSNMKFNVTLDDFNKYRDIFKSYGLGNKTNIDINEEQLGITGKTITGDLLLNLSIGQYDTYTPLMLNNYISTVANGGTRYKLRIVNYALDSKGNKININETEVLNKIDIESNYMDRIRLGLRNVIKYGTGAGYIPEEYQGSGKTGTSETYFNGIKTTTKSFVGYMPSDNPEYAISIISPNISYESSPVKSKYPVNSRIVKKITHILFEN